MSTRALICFVFLLGLISSVLQISYFKSEAQIHSLNIEPINLTLEMDKTLDSISEVTTFDSGLKVLAPHITISLVSNSAEEVILPTSISLCSPFRYDLPPPGLSSFTFFSV